MTDDQQQPDRDHAFFIQVALAGLIVFAAAVTIGLVTGAETGSVADWVAGISTFAAFGAAVIAARYAAGAFHLERQREERWVETQQAAQASLVAAWPDNKMVDFVTDGPGRIKKVLGKRTQHGVYVRNASDLPVTDAKVIYTVTQVRPDQPSASVDTPQTHLIGRVPPADEPRFYPIVPLTARLTGMHEQHKVTIDVEITFTDSTGIRWRREPRGQLSEVPEPS